MLLVRVWFYFLINSYFSKMPNLGPVLLGCVSRGESVDFIVVVIALCWPELKGRVTGLTPVVVIVVAGNSCSTVAPGIETFFGFLE